MTYTNYQWILKQRPVGNVKPSDFEYRESQVPELQEGESLIKTLYMAMDPATRGWMSDSGGYLEPLSLDKPVMGVIIGEVIATRKEGIKVGTVVAGVGDWAKYMIAGPDQISATRTGAQGVLAPMDTSSGHPLPMYLHALGTSGGTAWYGLMEIGKMQPGETVLVSGAAGSCGSLVCQFAKLKGAAKVVGIAGGADKCNDLVTKFGCDAAIDYKNESDLSEAIAREFPEGLDVYFDNVGGETLEAAMNNLAKNARVAICGMISQYNASEPAPGPKNMWNLLVSTARVEGFLVSDYFGTESCEQAYGQIEQWLSEGRLNAVLDIREEFDQVPQVYNQLFTGGNHGRLIVKVPD